MSEPGGKTSRPIRPAAGPFEMPISLHSFGQSTFQWFPLQIAQGLGKGLLLPCEQSHQTCPR